MKRANKKPLFASAINLHQSRLQDAVDDVIGPIVNRSVIVRAVRVSQNKLNFVDIELAD